MLQQFTVNFTFNPEDNSISDLTTFVDGIEQKKKTTRSSKKEKEEVVLEDTAKVTLEPTKLCFNNKAVADMELVYQDRLVIKYQKIAGAKKPIPLIAKDVDWNEEGTGNKLTKTNTLSYRGKANTILADFGSEFELELYKDKVWKLVSTNAPVKEEVTREVIEEEADGIDPTIFTDDDNTDEIGEISFTL